MRSYCRPMALLKTLSLAMTTPTTLCQSPLCCSCKAAVKLGMRYAAATMMQVVQTAYYIWNELCSYSLLLSLDQRV